MLEESNGVKNDHHEDEDEDEKWIDSATEEELASHILQVKGIFERYDISPESSPDSSGRNTPVFEIEERSTSLPEDEYGLKQSKPLQTLNPIHSQNSGSQEETRSTRHRRRSSLVDILLLADRSHSSIELGQTSNSTTFSKLLNKYSDGNGNSLDIIAEAETFEEVDSNELISPFINALKNAEDAELAWMQPKVQSGTFPMDDDLNHTNKQNGEVPLKLGRWTLSKDLWLGSTTFQIPKAEGEACMISSRQVIGFYSILAIATTTGTVLCKRITSIGDAIVVPTARCEVAMPPSNDQRPIKISSLALSTGSDDYLAIGYSNGTIAVFDIGGLAESSQDDIMIAPMLKVLRIPEHRDTPITSLGFCFCRQNESPDGQDNRKNIHHALQGTAKAAIGAMGMGHVCTLISGDKNGTVCTHVVSIVAPAMRMLRRNPIIAATTRVRGRLNLPILNFLVHPISNGVLVAIILPNSILFIHLPQDDDEASKLNSLGTLPKPSSAAFGSIPYVCWRKSTENNGLHEVFVSWDRIGQSIEVPEQPVAGNEPRVFKVTQEWRFEYSIASAHWLENMRIMLTLSEHGHVNLVQLPDEDLVTKGNAHSIDQILMQDSPARQMLAQERSFHGSSAITELHKLDGDTIFEEIEGQAAFTTVGSSGSVDYTLVLSPASRAYALYSRNYTDPHTAVTLAVEMLSYGANNVEVIGLRKQILSILELSIKHQLDTNSEMSAAHDIFNACIAIARNELKYGHVSALNDAYAIQEFLWKKAFPAFSTKSALSAFTKALEWAIMQHHSTNQDLINFDVSDMLRVPPEVMQKLVENLSSQPERIERCVLRIPIMCLDFNQVARLCHSHKLYSALAYLYNEGLNDALTPAIEMIKGMVECEDHELQRSLMRKFATYASCCFRGKRYPPIERQDTIDNSEMNGLDQTRQEPISNLVHREEQLHLVRTQLLKLILLHPIKQITAKGAQIVKDIDIEGPTLRFFLRIDAYLAISLLICAFDVWDALADDIMRAKDLPTDNLMDDTKSDRTALQLAVDVLSREAEICESRGGIGMADAGCIWMFIAHQVAIGRASFGTGAGTELLARVLEHLCLAASVLDDMERHTLFERAALNLINAWWDSTCSEEHAERIIMIASRAKLFLVCARIYTYCEKYELAVENMLQHMLKGSEGLSCTMRNRQRAFAFQMLSDLLAIKGPNEKEIKNAVVGKLETLTAIDAYRTANLIGVIHPAGNIDAATDLSTSTIMQKELTNYENDVYLVEQYIGALCHVDCNAVLPFLQRNEGHYRLNSILNVVMDTTGHKKPTCDDAAVYLLERLGDISGALQILQSVIRKGLYELSKKILELQDRVKELKEKSDFKAPTHIYQMPEAMATRDVLKLASDLCFRNAHMMDPGENEELWFRILSMFVSPVQDAKSAKSAMVDDAISYTLGLLQQFLLTLTRDTLMAMSDGMPLSAVVARLVREYSGSSLSSFRDILTDMMEACGREVSVLAMAKRVIDRDLVLTRKAAVSERRRKINRNSLQINGIASQHSGVNVDLNWLAKGNFSISILDNSTSASVKSNLHLSPPPGSEYMTVTQGKHIHMGIRNPGNLPSSAKFTATCMED